MARGGRLTLPQLDAQGFIAATRVKRAGKVSAGDASPAGGWLRLEVKHAGDRGHELLGFPQPGLSDRATDRPVQSVVRELPFRRLFR